MKILFLCSGNTCRSSMAECLFKEFVSENKLENINCESAGLNARDGEKASQNAILALAEIGLDLTKHRARNLKNLDLKDYDFFAVMNKNYKKELINFGIEPGNVYILNNLNGGITDPFGGNIEVYRKTRDLILSSFNDFYEFIKKINILKNSKLCLAKECDLQNIYIIEKESYSDAWSEDSILSEILNKDSYFLVLKNGDVILGYACLKLHLDDAELLKITTAQKFRNMGVAKILLKDIINFSKRKNIEKIILEVRESNTPAIKLYSSFGFKKIFVRKNFYSSPSENALTMQKDL